MKVIKPKKKGWQAALDELNAKYCVVQDGSKVRVHSFERHEHRGHVRLVSTFLPFYEFRNLHMHRTVKYEDGFIDIGELWLRHPTRRQYSGIVFQPGGDKVIDGKMNLWRGWGVEPKPGDWSLMKRHIFEVLASGDQEGFDYIMSWLAWAIQHPDLRAEVCLVFKGKLGTGKGTLGNAMLHLFGQHGVHISNSDHLTGRFNNHLRDACLLFADEAYFPGEKKAEGNLKRLVTEPTLFIEGKGRDGVEVTNMLHVILASNEDWIVPAGEHERRFVKFEVPDTHIQDSEWFEPIYTQLKSGGYAAMLYDLLHHDLRDWHPRKLPKDTGLVDQQMRSLKPLDAWWVALLDSGRLWGCDPYHPERAVSNSYDEEVSVGEHEQLRKRLGLFEQARSLVPHLRGHTTDHELGRYLSAQGCDNTKKVLRRAGWTFPPLADCRKAWELRYPTWSWHNQLTEWQAEEADDDLDQTEEELIERSTLFRNAADRIDAYLTKKRKEAETPAQKTKKASKPSRSPRGARV